MQGAGCRVQVAGCRVQLARHAQIPYCLLPLAYCILPLARTPILTNKANQSTNQSIMKKSILLIAFCGLMVSAASAQVYITRTGVINFFSKTPMEDIKAENNQVYAAIDLSKKTIAFSMLMKSFFFW